jgi:hypothetical protein
MGIRTGGENGVAIIAELLGPGRMAELADGFGFDLTNTFPRDAEFLADFFERPRPVIIKAIAESKDPFLTIGEVFHDFVKFIFKQGFGRVFFGRLGFFIFDEVA